MLNFIQGYSFLQALKAFDTTTKIVANLIDSLCPKIYINKITVHILVQEFYTLTYIANLKFSV